MWYWRGPSPFHFVSVTSEITSELRSFAPSVTYGWGMIPVSAMINTTQWSTSLFPKDGGYLVPIKSAVRDAEGLELGDVIEIALTIEV